MVLTNYIVDDNDDDLEVENEDYNKPEFAKNTLDTINFAEKCSKKATEYGKKLTSHGYKTALIYYNKYITLREIAGKKEKPDDSKIQEMVLNFVTNSKTGNPSEIPEAVLQELGGKRRSKHSRKTRRVRKSKRKGARKSRKH